MNVFISSLRCMQWRGFPVLVVPSVAWGNSFNWLGLLLLCGPATRSCGSRTWDGATCSTNHRRSLLLLLLLNPVFVVGPNNSMHQNLGNH
jgi:hypothetical protein